MAVPREAPEPAGSPLVEGQLRYFTALATGIRVVELRQRGAVVERIPGDARLWLRGLSELRRSPLMSADGFRIRWLTQQLDPVRANEQEVLSAILADERARGVDRVRIKVLDEYLGPIADSDSLRERLVSALTGSDLWRWEGAGIEGGYMPADSKVDWRTRWERARLPLPNPSDAPTEAEALGRLRERLSAFNVETIGRVCAERWMPRPVRQAATDELLGRWRRGSSHEEFRLVLDDAIETMLEALASADGATALVSAAVDPVLSLSMRGVAFSLLPVREGWSAEAEILKLASKSPNSRVASHWFRLWSDRAERVHALAILLRSTPPSADDEGTAVVKTVRDVLTDLGIEALPTVLEACGKACEVRGGARHVAAWLSRIDPDEERALLAGAVEGLATLRRLRDGQASEFTLLGLPRRRVQEGLARWLKEGEKQREERPTKFSWSAARSDAEWERDARRALAYLRESLDYDSLADAAVLLVESLRARQTRIDELRTALDSPENARRVLGEEAAETTRGDRAELLRSARNEVSAEREAERVQLARIVSETITAIQRTAVSTPSGGLAELTARVVELASDLGLAVTGEVGERVRIDPARHDTRGREGEEGEIRRVGIVDASGRVLVRPGVAVARRS
jgi:hypothetical protein